ncbi:sigma-70 family RNA polymerase sigma factor [Fulvivirgaceae bacterium BMA10]|uniref:Sigma-70 family RNA polymerase sigma factor n=1 Tax=Splendidivirga corallicola TaxID=3051826 RepID=A0ABT8KN54_9BACT|nr:sigma-70 family RNA polymerase sigma factor [Fulvivirgaceae bacterium BMA10]
MGEERKNTEKNILVSISKGSHKSFELLYKKHSQMVFRYAFKSLKCKSEADDIVQQTFVQVWQNKEKLKDIHSPKDYIFIISKNLIFARLRVVLKNELLSEELKLHMQLRHNKSEEDLIYSEIKKIAKEAIESLPKQRKLIFKLSKEMDYSQDEIAEKLCISKNTVKESLRKAYGQIRTKLSVEADIVFSILILLFYFLYP